MGHHNYSGRGLIKKLIHLHVDPQLRQMVNVIIIIVSKSIYSCAVIDKLQNIYYSK